MRAVSIPRPEACKEGRSETLRPTGLSKTTAKLTIIDATGRKVVEKKIRFENTYVMISIDLIDGLYDIVICDEVGRIYSKKIIISE